MRRAGRNLGGRPHGCWPEWTAAGELEHQDFYWHGERATEVPDPEGLCGEGATRLRRVVDGKVEDSCMALDERGDPVLEGPTITFAGPPRRDDTPLCRLDDLLSPRPWPDPEPANLWIEEWQEFQGGVRHGLHRRWLARDRPQFERTYAGGDLDGPLTSWYAEGALRERAEYRAGLLHGPREFWHPDGTPRWRAQYEEGRLLAANGDLAVAGEPCPEGAVPVLAEGTEGIEYGYRLWRVVCAPFRQLEIVSEGRGAKPSATFELAPSRRGEMYLFEVEARRDGRHVGGFTTHGSNGLGWDLRFRVR